MTDGTSGVATEAIAWRDVGQIVAAQILALREAGLLDDAAAATLLGAADAVSRAAPPSAGSLAALIASFDERLDAQTPPEVAGAAALGRGTADAVAALVRLAARRPLLALAGTVNELQRRLLDLAAAHATTLMPAYAAAQPVQPTTFAHFLGGVIGPLGRAAASFGPVYAAVNRSPLGAAALASTGVDVDRARVAALLGFDGLVESTFDAVSAVDHVNAVTALVRAVAAGLRRFIAELLTWLRTEPTSFRLDPAWTTSDPALPQVNAPVRLERLGLLATEIEGVCDGIEALTRAIPYGPVPGPAADALDRRVPALLRDAADLAAGTRDLITHGLAVNRAYLANRAGKGHTTSGDLADFLLVAEGLSPAAARAIATLTVRKALGEGIEAGGITPEMIDAAALLVIGREVKVEAEGLGRHLAPRRFVERRTATGAPAPVATRAYLDRERLRLAAAERWQTETSARLDATEAALDRLAADLVADGPG